MDSDEFLDFDGARNSIICASLLDYGVPYRWGGNSPTTKGIDAGNTPWDKSLTRGKQGGMDCSGAVLRWIRASGVNCKDYSASQLFRALTPTMSPWRGDLAFYGRNSHVSHVALCLTDSGDVIIGANGGGRPKLHEAFGDYCQRMADAEAEVKIELNGYKYRSDFLGFRKPPFAGEIK